MDELFLELEEINLIYIRLLLLILELNLTEFRLFFSDSQINVFGYCFAEAFDYFSDTG